MRKVTLRKLTTKTIDIPNGKMINVDVGEKEILIANIEGRF